MLLLCLLLLGFPAWSQSWIHKSGYECPEDWAFDKGTKTCVKPFHEKISWDKAQVSCQGKGGDLAVIKSSSTSYTINVLLRRRQRYWIGVHDKDNDLVHTFIDGSVVTKKLQRWARHEPSNHSGKERCVEMIGNKRGNWNDKRCAKKRYYVCQQPAVLALECPVDWKLLEEDKLCIYPHEERKSWRKARATCKEDGGDLLKLHKKEIAKFIRDDLVKRNRYWIGAWDEDKDSIFKFIDGQKVRSFKRWAHDEPNNLRGNEHCLEVIGNRRVSWNDKRCSRRRSFVCQRTANIVETLPSADLSRR